MVIAAYLMSLDAGARIFEGLHGRQSLREKPGLHLLCNFQFLCEAAFRIQLLNSALSLSFNCPVDHIKAHQCKRVSVQIREPGEYSAPNRRLCGCRFLRRMRGRHVPLIFDPSQAGCVEKPNPSPSPFFKLRNHILGNENNSGCPADELVLIGVRRRRDQGKDRTAVGRRNRYPAVARCKPRIKSHVKAELVHIESQALILISNENVDGVNTKERPFCVDAGNRCVRVFRRREVAHGNPL